MKKTSPLSIANAHPPDLPHAPTGITMHSGNDEEMFFAALRSSRMAMIITNPRQTDNPVIFANPAFLNLTGYELSEVLGRNCRFLQGERTGADTISAIRSAIDEGSSFETELINYRKNGTCFWNALYVSPIFDANTNAILYFFASQLDVTYIHEAADRARVANHMEALGEITGGIIHDLNNLLQVITGYADLLDDAFNAIVADGTKRIERMGPRATKSIKESAERAVALIEQLLAFSRRQHQPVSDVVDLNATIVPFVDGLAARVIKRGEDGNPINVEYVFADALWMTSIDRGQFEMAILNIMINARDAMPGGGTITISTNNEQVGIADALSHRPAGRYVCVGIRDTGVGIDPAILKRVKEPFFTTKPEGRGTGLGLAAVQRFMDACDGYLEIESKVGKGTQVTLYFPAMVVTTQVMVDMPNRIESAA